MDRFRFRDIFARIAAFIIIFKFSIDQNQIKRHFVLRAFPIHTHTTHFSLFVSITHYYTHTRCKTKQKTRKINEIRQTTKKKHITYTITILSTMHYI